MKHKRHIAETIFYIFSILLCIAAICFLLNMLKYDNCKYKPKTTHSHDCVTTKDYYDVRGSLLIEFNEFPNNQFKADLHSLITKENFEKMSDDGKTFKIVYSDNIIQNDVYELISLECDNAVLISAESRKFSVTLNIIINIVGIAFFSIGLFSLSKAFIKNE